VRCTIGEEDRVGSVAAEEDATGSTVGDDDEHKWGMDDDGRGTTVGCGS
jgi:hypothetical protein